MEALQKTNAKEPPDEKPDRVRHSEFDGQQPKRVIVKATGM
jgi:hypothetical protein